MHRESHDEGVRCFYRAVFLTGVLSFWTVILYETKLFNFEETLGITELQFTIEKLYIEVHSFSYVPWSRLLSKFIFVNSGCVSGRS